MTEFWDRSGRSVAYVADDGKSVYLWDGSPVAWISDGGVYGYNGRFLGWFGEEKTGGKNGDILHFLAV